MHLCTIFTSIKWIIIITKLSDLEWRNSPKVCIISPNSVAFGAHYVKVVEDTPILSATEM